MSSAARGAVGLVYDAGALVAAERNDLRFWALHRRALERGVVPVVPTPVLAQVWRGAGQHAVSALLQGCRTEPLDAPDARAAGAALGRSRTSDVVDACVVVTALRRGDAVATSDRADLERLAVGLGARLSIIDV